MDIFIRIVWILGGGHHCSMQSSMHIIYVTYSDFIDNANLREGHLSVVKYLTEKHGADLKQEDNRGRSPLLLAVRWAE